MRRHLVDDRGVERTRVAFAGYWRRALAQDDPPTPEDARDEAEMQAEVGLTAEVAIMAEERR